MSKEVEKIRAVSDVRYYIALDDLSFEWTADEIDEAIKMYRKKKSLHEMAEKLRPYTASKDALDEVALLLMHLARKGRIRPRVSGWLGSSNQ